MRTFIITIIFLSISGCSIYSLEARRQYSDNLAITQNWQRITIPTLSFDITAYVPKRFTLKDTLTIYIEGDGLAWISRNQRSSDPTPQNPIALKLALKHPTGNAAYLARPCQYIRNENKGICTKKYWSSHRFSDEVISSSNQAVSALKSQFHAKDIVLVGYSGGGAVAALIAARRHDISLLVTVAGNLDHKTWTKQFNISPLNGSLNPADEWEALKDTPQIHFVGSKDNTMPATIGYAFQQHFPKEKQPNIQIIDGFDHHCCWVENWSSLFPPKHFPF